MSEKNNNPDSECTTNGTIFLIAPPTRSYTQRMPLGLMTISSFLSSKGHDNHILDYKGIDGKAAYKRIQKAINASQPSFIGITSLISEVGIVKKICEYTRKVSPKTTIILGGPHPSICPEHFVDTKVPFDYTVVGEGEITFYELVDAIQNKKDIKKVDGVAYLYNKNKLVYTKPRELIKDLDILPFPAYDKIDMKYYTRPNVWAIRPIYLSSFNMFTSRGCPFNCNFCVAHTIFGRKVRFMSPEKVADHIEYVLKKFRIDGLYFADESFTVNKERIYKIFNILKKRKILFVWGCETRVNLLDEKLLRYMKNNGCLQIDFGIESGSDRMLKIMNKGTTVDQIRKIGNICKRIRLRHLANMMINIPGETIDDINLSVRLAKDMRYNVVFWNTYTPFPGSNFGKEIDIEDLDLLLEYPSKTTFDLLERKYKFGSYDRSLLTLVDELYTKTFHPKHIKLSFDPKYWLSFFSMINYVFDPKYISAILKSKRKTEYIKNLFRQKTSI
ncbi:MAG: B12-binding domain-containing radical SAM protein [Nanoarchaeota archaeon]|nr:B12-binding domain-containing radical SAM protein [Nanoarchaeota archaeon]